MTTKQHAEKMLQGGAFVQYNPTGHLSIREAPPGGFGEYYLATKQRNDNSSTVISLNFETVRALYEVVAAHREMQQDEIAYNLPEVIK